MTALVIYIVISGASVPWIHRIVMFPTPAECAIALPREVAIAAKSHKVHSAGCIKLADK